MAEYPRLIYDTPEIQAILDSVANKVDKVEGKGLSANDYTDEDKTLVGSAYQKPQTGIPASDLESGVAKDAIILRGIPSAGTYTEQEFTAACCSVQDFLKLADGNHPWAVYVETQTGSSTVTSRYSVVSSDSSVFGQHSCSVTLRAYNNTFITIAYYQMSGFFTVTYQSFSDKQDKVVISNNWQTTDVTLELAKNHEYRYTADVATLTLSLPSMFDGDFSAWLVFKSGATATVFSCSETIKWSGDDVANNVFTPTANRVYNIKIWYDGIFFNADVRGVDA